MNPGQALNLNECLENGRRNCIFNTLGCVSGIKIIIDYTFSLLPSSFLSRLMMKYIIIREGLASKR